VSDIGHVAIGTQRHPPVLIAGNWTEDDGVFECDFRAPPASAVTRQRICTRSHLDFTVAIVESLELAEHRIDIEHFGHEVVR